MFTVGQQVISSWRRTGRDLHVIKAIHDNRITPVAGMNCQSGVLVQVFPALEGLTEKCWIDIGWFRPFNDGGGGPCAAA